MYINNEYRLVLGLISSMGVFYLQPLKFLYLSSRRAIPGPISIEFCLRNIVNFIPLRRRKPSSSIATGVGGCLIRKLVCGGCTGSIGFYFRGGDRIPSSCFRLAELSSV
ncbi:hypothetical protein CEXT_376731 [Caerostris extrusa]|uniref:Secreted protein n=1 Tax=Caerostris extrusa TaxID=172846 RepID=A0AAV4NTS8_CAEEX|nr:hypothetical protein CEXT_376731 [Caerostris extrusa]